MEYIYIFSGHLFVMITYILSVKICLEHLKKPLKYFIILGLISIIWLSISSLLCINFDITINTLLIPFICLLFWPLYININLSIYKFLFIFLSTHCIGEIIMYLVILIKARLAITTPSNFQQTFTILFIQCALSTPILIGFLNTIIISTLKKMINFQFLSTKFWKIIWILPLFVNIILLLFIPQNTNVLSISRIGNLSIILYLIITSLIVIIYFLLYKSSVNFENLLQEKDKNHTLNMQTLQYNYLNDRIEEAKRAGHDLKQHFRAIRSYIDNNDLEGIKIYLSNLEYYSPNNSSMTYCKNIILNSIFVYYLDLINQLNVEKDIQINLLENSAFKTSSLTVLFGNLLENSYEALTKQTKNLRYFKFKIIEKKDNSMFIIIDNSHNNLIRKDNKNNFFSSKRTDTLGIGLVSIKKIIDQLNGTINIDYDQNNFKISIFIKTK